MAASFTCHIQLSAVTAKEHAASFKWEVNVSPGCTAISSQAGKGNLALLTLCTASPELPQDWCC